MATLIFNGESFTVDHAVKGADYVHGYSATGECIISIEGIKDFSVVTYNGVYLTPEVCFAEGCNEVRHVAGKLVRQDGAAIKAEAIDAADTIQSASGELISIDDSDNASLYGLKLFGKTTQDGTPTPTAPVELVTAGASGAINTTVVGKNLIDPKFVSHASDDTKLYATLLLKAGIYTVQYVAFTNGTLDSIYVRKSDTLDKIKSVNGVNAMTFTLSETTKVRLDFVKNDGLPSVSVDSVMLEVGSTATAYEPYTAQTLTASTPNGLAGIPVSECGNYTDAEGQQYICDEIDFAKGVYVQRVSIIDANSLSWKTSERNFFYASLPLGGNNVLCSNYPCIGAYTDPTVPSLDKTITLYANLSGIRIKDGQYTDASSLAASLDGVKIAYPLATPIETPIPAEELAAYAALHSNKPNTTVYNDAGAGMEINYCTPNTAVPITQKPDDNGKVLGINEHGSVVPVQLSTENLEDFDERHAQKADVVQFASGDLITVDNSGYMPLHGLKLFGKTTQFTTTGKNLLDIPEKYTFTGTTYPVRYIPQGSYLVSWSPSTQGGDLAPFIAFSDANGTTMTAVGLGSALQQRVTFNSDVTRVSFYANGYSVAGSEGITSTINRLMISVDGGEYEPYTGGIASPSPEYPQDLVSAGASGAINTAMAGKNLLPISAYKAHSLNGVVANTRDDGAIQLKGTSTAAAALKIQRVLLPAGTSTFWTEVDGSYTTIHSQLRRAVGDGVGDYIVPSYNVGSAQTFTLTEPVLAEVRLYYSASGVYDCAVRIQIERGAEKTAYEPYKGQTLTTATPNGLPGIEVTDPTLANYTDADGKMWCCDYIDYERGKYINRIVTKVLDGTESWKQCNPDTWYDFAYYLSTGNGSIAGFSHSRIYCLCNQYIPMSRSDIQAATKAGYCSIGANGNELLFTADLATVEEWKAELVQKYEAGTPVIIQYVRKTPIETALSTEELAAYAELHSNNPNTTVYNDAGSYMEVEYYTPTTAVQATRPLIDAGKVLAVDEHGCVVAKEVSASDVGAAPSVHKHTKSQITDFPSTETWTFTLEDGSTVTKAVYVG